MISRCTLIRLVSDWFFTKKGGNMVLFIEPYLAIPIISPILDYWSFVHLATAIALGVAMARMRHSQFLAFTGIAGYEIVENYLLVSLFHKELLANSLTDIVIGCIGFSLTRYVVLAVQVRRAASEKGIVTRISTGIQASIQQLRNTSRMTRKYPVNYHSEDGQN